jgi:hypothetical protein
MKGLDIDEILKKEDEIFEKKHSLKNNNSNDNIDVDDVYDFLNPPVKNKNVVFVTEEDIPTIKKPIKKTTQKVVSNDTKQDFFKSLLSILKEYDVDTKDKMVQQAVKMFLAGLKDYL